MKFQTTKEAEEHFVKHETLPSDFTMPDYWGNYDNKPGMGDWMLFRQIDGNKKLISPPILALVVGHTVWDMALVLEYVTQWRGWEYNSKVLNKNANCYYQISDADIKVKHVQFWTDDILVLGAWNKKPSFRELRKAMTN